MRSVNLFAAVIIWFTCAASPLRAQLPTMSDVDDGKTTAVVSTPPEWDTAVVKPHPPEDHNMSWQITADSVVLVNLSLEQLICSAWDLKPYQVSGISGWMQSSRFDLTAKVSEDDAAAYNNLTVEQRRNMLQKLMMERFRLKVHTETKTLPTYDLVVDKGGSKLQVSRAIEAPSREEMNEHPEKYRKGEARMGPGMYEGTGVAVRSLASQLSNAVGKPVHDATKLSGSYDIKLHYRPGELAPDGGENSDAPSVFSAVQEQLGLKLIPSQGPVETLVVDAAQQPEAN
jgi:uncharacterized protein (TIGR03435 family)